MFFQNFLYSSCAIRIPFKFLIFNQGPVSIHHIEIFSGMCVNEYSQLSFADMTISVCFFNGPCISTPDREYRQRSPSYCSSGIPLAWQVRILLFPDSGQKNSRIPFQISCLGAPLVGGGLFSFLWTVNLTN